MAPALLKSLGSILGLMPIAYVLRIETSDGNAYQCSASSSSAFEGAAASLAGGSLEIETT